MSTSLQQLITNFPIGKHPPGVMLWLFVENKNLFIPSAEDTATV